MTLTPQSSRATCYRDRWLAAGTPRLNVLVLDEEIPYPPNSGKRIRTWNLLRRLAQRHSVTLLCYGAENDPGAEAIRAAGIQLTVVGHHKLTRGWRLYVQLLLNLFSRYPFSVAKHYSSRFQQELANLLTRQTWDLVQCEWTPYARYTSEIRDFPVLVTTHNIESQILGRRAQQTKNGVARAFFRLQESKMLQFEREALLLASAATAVTPQDLGTMKTWGIKTAVLVPNGVASEVHADSSTVENGDEILFLASLDWYPNVDSLHYFVQDIFPIVRTRNPAAHLRIIGRRPSKTLVEQYSAMPAIHFVGEVADITQFIQEASVFVVPLRIGGGSRIKILEALSAEKAVVSTSIGAEGLDTISNEHLVIADEPEEFAARIVELLASKETRARIAQNGRRLVEELYGWDEIANRLESVWFALAKPVPELTSYPAGTTVEVCL